MNADGQLSRPGAVLELAKDTGIELRPDYRRVIARLFIPGHEDVGPGDSRATPVIERILVLGDDEVSDELDDLFDRFAHRHRDLRAIFFKHGELVRPRIDTSIVLSEQRHLLLGATFTHEYILREHHCVIRRR